MFFLSYPIYCHDIKCYLWLPNPLSPVMSFFLRSTVAIQPPLPSGYLHKPLTLKICKPEWFIFFLHISFLCGLSFSRWCHHPLATQCTWSHPWFFQFPYQAPSPVDSVFLMALESILFLQLPTLAQAFISYLTTVVASFVVFLSPVRLPLIFLSIARPVTFLMGRSDHGSERPLLVTLCWLDRRSSTFWSFPSSRACSGDLGQLCSESDAPVSTLLKCSVSHHPCLPQQSSFPPWPSCSPCLPFLALWWQQRARWWEEVSKDEMKSTKEAGAWFPNALSFSVLELSVFFCKMFSIPYHVCGFCVALSGQYYVSLGASKGSDLVYWYL